MKRLTTTLLMLAGAALLPACSQPEAEAPAPAIPVRVQAADSGPAAPAIIANGIVTTKNEMRLSFKVGGVIRSIDVQEGQSVRAGERLAAIELTEIEAQLEQARQLAEKARRDLERGERLYADQVISLEQLEDLRTQAALRQAELRSARFNRGYAVITAPRAAVVLRKLAEARELVPAGQPVLVLGARDEGFVVRAALADREVVQLRLGDPVEVRMDAFPGAVFTGALAEIASAADERTGLFSVEARLDSPPPGLVSGLVAKLEIQPASARAGRLTYVPVGALVEGSGDRASVFVVDGDQVRRREVRIAFFAREQIALAAGLEAGERVVTDGALYLQDAERIEEVQDAAQVVGALGVGPR